MKLKLISFASLLVLGMVFSLSAFAAKPKQQKKELTFQYDLEYIKSVADGVSQIKVYSYGNSRQEAQDRGVINAVHGVVFKGYSGQGAYQAPLVKAFNGYNDNKDFFDNFFRKGDYLRYSSGVVEGTQQFVKVKGGWKYGCIVNVNVRMLRQHLEEAGIIKGLASGF
ncbi:MAG: hypothetical protein KBS53_03790 [Bacteroidales bacterium]|nr:hypothetical protein [Candidatus Hennigimonas equi]